MTLIGAIILVILILIILMAQREWAAVGVIAGVIYLTSYQHVYIGGFLMFAVRFIEIAGILRIVVRREFATLKINAIDKSFLIFQSSYLAIFLIRSLSDQSLIETNSFRIGYFCDGVMSYFIFRSLLINPLIFRQFLKICAFVIVPFALFMIVESITGRNLFAFEGGIPPFLRDGHYRAQGVFGVAITAGSFGATLLPLFISIILSREGVLWGLVGVVTCMAITVASHSSGPLIASVVGIAAWMCWSIRKRMKIVRWSIILFIILLQLTMKPPVWFIFNRMSDYLGGGGWHRSNLIDQFVRHFDDWWLMGMSLEKTANWAATTLDNGAVDITNEYIAIGVSAGLITLILFIRLLTKCCQAIGESMRKIRADADYHQQDELLLWGIGSSLVSHIINISSVRYWDQSYVIWYMVLAVVSGMTAYYVSNNSVKYLEQ